MKLQRKKRKRDQLIKSSGPEFAAKKFSLKNKEEFIAKVKDLTD